MYLKCRDYKEIQVKKGDGSDEGILLVNITDDEITEKDGYYVELVAEEE